MISQKYIKELGFKTIEDIFAYIVESEKNGQYTQMKEMVNKLSSTQFLGLLQFGEHNIELSVFLKIVKVRVVR